MLFGMLFGILFWMLFWVLFGNGRGKRSLEGGRTLDLRAFRSTYWPRPFHRAMHGVVLAAVLGQALVLGCASTPKPRKSCIVLEASEELNFYDGVPHPVTVYVYALATPEGFEGARPDDLLVGAKPAGVLQPPVPITVQPGEQHSVQELFPADTHQLGLLADFYRAPNDPMGSLTQVVPARCGLRRPKLVLSQSDIHPKP